MYRESSASASATSRSSSPVTIPPPSPKLQSLSPRLSKGASPKPSPTSSNYGATTSSPTSIQPLPPPSSSQPPLPLPSPQPLEYKAGDHLFDDHSFTSVSSGSQRWKGAGHGYTDSVGLPMRGGSGSSTNYSTQTATTATSTYHLYLLVVVTILAGVGNNISFVKMGIAMPLYPAFLLCVTTALYVVIFFIWLWLKQSAQQRQMQQQLQQQQQHRYSSASQQPLIVQATSNYHDFTQSRSTSGTNTTTTLKPTAGLFKHYTGVALLVVIGGICSQYSNVFVGGTIQSFSNQLTLPIVTLLVAFYYQHRYSRLEVIGILLVAIGSLIGIIMPLVDPPKHQKQTVEDDLVYQQQYNRLFWVLLFTASDIPSALTNVAEEYILHHYPHEQQYDTASVTPYTQPSSPSKTASLPITRTSDSPTHTDEIHYLAWSNLISLLGYVLAIPVMFVPKIGNIESWRELYSNQVDAYQCFIGNYHHIDGCAPGAYQPILCFVVCVVVYFYSLAVLIKVENTVYQVIVQALVTPLSAIAFSFQSIMHQHAEPLSHYTIVASLLVPTGILIYKLRDMTQDSSGGGSDYEVIMGSDSTGSGYASSGRDEEILPLIARH